MYTKYIPSIRKFSILYKYTKALLSNLCYYFSLKFCCHVWYFQLPQWFSLVIYWQKKLNWYIIFNVMFLDVQTTKIIDDDCWWIYYECRSSKDDIGANAEKLTEKDWLQSEIYSFILNKTLSKDMWIFWHQYRRHGGI